MSPISLYPKQAQVLAAAADGAPLSTVATRVGIPREQVAARLSEAYKRLQVTWMPRSDRRAAAVRIAQRHGLIPATRPLNAPQPPDGAEGQLSPERPSHARTATRTGNADPVR